MTPAQKAQLQWGHLQYPYLAFIPVRPTFDGLLLCRLNTSGPQALHERQLSNGIETKFFHMKSSLRESWGRLEDLLVQCCEILYPYTQYRALAFPRRPFSYGFSSVHDNEAKTQELILASRDTFIPWIAMLSFLISQLEEPRPFVLQDKSTVTLPQWMGILAVRRNMHMTWVNSIFTSMICNWGIQRIGLILDLMMENMVFHRVALVYKWEIHNPQYILGEYLSNSFLQQFIGPTSPITPESQ